MTSDGTAGSGFSDGGWWSPSRFVRGRDSLWYKHHLLTDETTPQWKQVLQDCNVKVTYALSPQAKGKMERPYGWLQD